MLEFIKSNPFVIVIAVVVILFILFLQQLDGNFIGPKILGDSTGLSSFWVIFSITLFGGIFGIPGMIIGVPLFAIIYAAIKAFVNEALIKKNLSAKTDSYTDVECIDEDGVHKYDFTNSRNDKEFHSGSKFISSIEEWNFRYSQKKKALTSETPNVQETSKDEEK